MDEYRPFSGEVHEPYSLSICGKQRYVKKTTTGYNYVYNYTDHLGNVRVSYEEDATGSATIIDENNYYPLGMKHSPYNLITPASDYKYKYNGKEIQDELGLNVTAMDYRQYDNAIGRFNVIDLLSELDYSGSSYSFAGNNPVFFADPSGLTREASQTAPIYYDWDRKAYVNQYTGYKVSIEEAMFSINASRAEMLPEVTINIRNGDKRNGDIIRWHVYQNSKYYEGWRSQQNSKKWDDFGQGLQDTGDIIAGAGYLLTLTGVGAGIGVPLAALGNTISATGAVIQVGNSFYHQGLGSGNAWKTVGFQVAGRVTEHYLNKVPGLEPTIKSIDDTEVMNLSNKILQQNISLKLMGIERYYDYKTKKE